MGAAELKRKILAGLDELYEQFAVGNPDEKTEAMLAGIKMATEEVENTEL